jgi:carbonic anhydrase
MKKPVLLLLSVALCLSGTLVFAADSQSATKLTHESEPLLDLGAELDSSTPQAKEHVTRQAASQTPVAKPKTETADEHAIHWGYTGPGGPNHWGELAPENISCKIGKNQSPIDLRDKAAVGTTGLPQLDVVYQDVPLKVLNNGHTVQVNYPLGSYIKVGGHRYELLQFHFHTPSEHKKEGFNYPMEMHLVHKDGDGHLAVMAILFQEGEENETLDTLLSHLPRDVGKQHVYKNASLNPASFIPGNTDFYKYSGSLTTPPCSEGVYWMVFKTPIQASAGQIQQMNDLMGDNSRPFQEMNARAVLKSWAEPLDEPPLYEFY